MIRATGLLYNCQENVHDTRSNLSMGLKVAHSKLGNHEVMYHLLNKLSQMQLSRGDTAGAEQMLKSAFMLGKQANDLVGILGCLEVMEELYKVKKMDEKLVVLNSHRESRLVALKTSRESAMDADLHILEDWDIS